LVFLNYSAEILPQITLIGKDNSLTPHKNIRRTSDDYIFYLITSGELFVCEDGREYALKKGDCFLFEPKLLHFGTKSSVYNLIYIHFKHKNAKIVNISKEKWLENVHNEGILRAMGGSVGGFDDVITLPKQISFCDTSLFYNLCSIAERGIETNKLILENNKTLTAMSVDELFIEIYRLFIKMNSNSPKTDKMHLINTVLDYLNNNYMNKITGDKISKDLCYSFDYLNQVFKKHLDTSIFKVLENIRIKAAKKLIKASNFSLEKISEGVGFKDVAYFSKTFKKNTGISPSKYRAELLGKDL